MENRSKYNLKFLKFNFMHNARCVQNVQILLNDFNFLISYDTF